MERFPISICMAGAVSAGAYSAGVMSVLLDALRILEDDDLELPSKPKHRVVLKGMSGASAGSIQAALSTLDIFSSKDENGLYPELGKKAWLEATIDKLLNTDDLGNDDRDVYSILNSDKLRENALERTREHIKTQTIPGFVAGSFQLRFSITNLRGVPYTLNFPKGTKVDFGMSQHNEYLRYSFSVKNEKSSKHYAINPLKIRDRDYLDIVTGALASGSFPAAFSITDLKRPNLNSENYFTDLSVPMLGDANEENGKIKANFSMQSINPDWRYDNVDTVYAVDGGATNNEPLVEAFKILYGQEFWEWEAAPKDKTGRVIFIDPFPNPVDKKLNKNGTRVDKALGLMVSALIGQARFSPKLIASKGHQNKIGLVFPSLPWKKPIINNKGETVEQYAIKSGALGGFSGFLKKEFMEHDYELGRLNMRRFLRYHFTLDKNNSLFQNDGEYKNNWDNGHGQLPIIPVYQKNEDGTFSIFENSDDEKVAYYREGLSNYEHKYEFEDRKQLSKQLTNRLKTVGIKMINIHGKSEKGRAKRSSNTGSASRFFMKLGWKVKGVGFLNSSIMRTIENSLYEQDLLEYSLFEEDESVDDLNN